MSVYFFTFFIIIIISFIVYKFVHIFATENNVATNSANEASPSPDNIDGTKPLDISEPVITLVEIFKVNPTSFKRSKVDNNKYLIEHKRTGIKFYLKINDVTHDLRVNGGRIIRRDRFYRALFDNIYLTYDESMLINSTVSEYFKSIGVRNEKIKAIRHIKNRDIMTSKLKALS